MLPSWSLPRYTTYWVTTEPSGADQVSWISCCEAWPARFWGLPGGGGVTWDVAALVRDSSWPASSVKLTVTLMVLPCWLAVAEAACGRPAMDCAFPGHQ